MKKISITFILLFISFNTFAYLDPGTGSILIQGLIALISGVIIFFKNIKSSIIKFLKKIKK